MFKFINNFFNKTQDFSQEELSVLEQKGFEAVSSSKVRLKPLYPLSAPHEAVDGIEKFGKHFLSYSKVSIVMGYVGALPIKQSRSDHKKVKTLEEAMSFFHR